MLYRLSHQEALDELMVNFNIIATGAVLTELRESPLPVDLYGQSPPNDTL